MYHAVDAAVIRVSVFPLVSTLPLCPPAAGDEAADADCCRRWIAEVWADEARAGAIELAAPVLAAGVRKVLTGTVRDSRIRRTAVSLTRYLLRMRYRATPFGLFAGPAPVRLGPAPRVAWGTDHKAFARADALWLHEIITALEQDPEVLRHLTVVADPTCIVRGDQISVPHQPGVKGPTQTTLRRTRAAETVLSIAQSSSRVGDIVDKLRADYPGTPVETIEAMVHGLVAHRVLLTSLHAPMTCDDALGHLVTELRELDPAAVSQVAPAVEELGRIHRLLDQHDRAEPGEQRAIRVQAVAAMSAFTGNSERSLAVNLRPDCDIALPEEVAREAEQALEVIARITPFPNGTVAWQDYRARFLERYSVGLAVPVRDLTDPDTGLGFPVGYRGTVLKRPVLPTDLRDEHLLSLAQDAALTGRRAIELTEADIEALAVGTPTQVPAHIEFHFTVLAQSARDLAEGHFTLSTNGLSMAAGITTGRFLTTLDPTDRDRIAAVHAALPTLTEGAVRGQVSGPPLKVPINNVSRAPLVAPELLSVGEYHPDTTLDLDDLGIVADTQRLYLVSLSTGRIIEPSVMNAVELSSSTHPLIRFLCEVHRAHAAVLLPFSWGAAGSLPFLPEVRVGRTVLSAARWRIRPRDLDDGDDWTARLAAWRIRYEVPRFVYLGSSDRRLRLDLGLPVHQQLLRADLKRHPTAVLSEAPAESDYGWIDRAHEVTVVFASRQQRLPAPAYNPDAVAERASGRLPGGSTQWAFLKVYGSAARAPEVLTAHIPRLLHEAGIGPADWWFIRYADPGAHLRLRLHLPSTDVFGAVAQRVAAWATELRREGLIQRVAWDTDYPEIGRYGTGTALESAERFFAADSSAALAQLAVAVPADDRPAVTAASYVDIATGLLGSQPTASAWLTQHLPRASDEKIPRNVLAFAVRLTSPSGGPALADLAGGEAVTRAWRIRATALDQYGCALDAAGIDPTGVLPSLLHMHHIRVAGVDRDAEAACRRLARAAALSWTVRPEGAPR